MENIILMTIELSIKYEDINIKTVEALIATEDERFYSHPGIDLKATFRAIVFLNTRGGASTISQQLLGNYLLEFDLEISFNCWSKNQGMGYSCRTRKTTYQRRNNHDVS